MKVQASFLFLLAAAISALPIEGDLTGDASVQVYPAKWHRSEGGDAEVQVYPAKWHRSEDGQPKA